MMSPVKRRLSRAGMPRIWPSWARNSSSRFVQPMPGHVAAWLLTRLQRNFGFLSMLGFASTLMASWEALAMSVSRASALFEYLTDRMLPADYSREVFRTVAPLRSCTASSSSLSVQWQPVAPWPNWPPCRLIFAWSGRGLLTILEGSDVGWTISLGRAIFAPTVVRFP